MGWRSAVNETVLEGNWGGNTLGEVCGLSQHEVWVRVVTMYE